MTPREERFTRPELAGVRLRTLRWGSEERPCVVLLHGAGANAWWWAHLAPELARDFHVVALDFRGHGDSDHPEERRPGDFVRDLEALLEELSAPEALLVGHSLGAHVAATYASNGGRPRGLVMIDLGRGAPSARRRATQRALTWRRTYASREEALRRFAFLPGESRVPEALRDRIAGHSVREEEDGRFGFKFDPRWFAIEPSGTPDFERITCPTLLLRGAESTLLSPEAAAELGERIPDARLVEVADAGHHVQLERPEETLRLLGEFLEEL